MKINRYTRLSLLVLSFCGTSLFYSCSDDDSEDTSCNGAPAISKISTALDRETAITGGTLEDWIIIQGSNFCNVEQVSINDVSVSLKDAYVTPNEITLKIPRTIPGAKTDKVSVKTGMGETQHDYVLNLPPTSIKSAINEYTAVGDTMILLGENYDIYGLPEKKGKVYFGTVEGTVIRSSSDSLYVKVPAGATAGAAIKIVSPFGEEKTAPFLYQDNRNLIWNFDGKNGGDAATPFITEGPAPAPLSGKFLRINRQVGSWDPVQFIRADYTLPEDVVKNPDKYLLKFELNTRKPFNANAIKIWIDYDGGASPFLNWTGVPAVNTFGEWVTRTINLIDVVKAPVNVQTAYTFRMIYHGNGALDADMSFDNIRIVPKP